LELCKKIKVATVIIQRKGRCELENLIGI
jgi:hypothetical protein